MKKDYKLFYDLGYQPVFRFKGTDHAFTLSASPLDKDWSNTGQIFLSLFDDGNGLHILLDGKHRIDLTYSEAETLRLALKLNNPTTRLAEVIETKVK